MLNSHSKYTKACAADLQILIFLTHSMASNKNILSKMARSFQRVLPLSLNAVITVCAGAATGLLLPLPLLYHLPLTSEISVWMSLPGG